MDENRSNIELLLRLIDDPDENVWHPIRETIIKGGKIHIPVLQEQWQNASNNIQASRIEELISDLQFNELQKAWIKWWNNNSATLKEGVTLVEQIIDPEFNLAQLETLLKPIKNKIWIELSDKLTALEKIRIINHFFFQQHGFVALDNTDSKAKNNYIRNIFLSGSGAPLSISLLYCLLCRELSIPVYKVGKGDNASLSFLNQNPGIHVIQNLSNYSSLFFILPDMQGKVIGQKQYIELSQVQYPTQTQEFELLSDKSFIRIILQKLYYSYKEEKNTRRLSQIKHLLSLSVVV